MSITEQLREAKLSPRETECLVMFCFDTLSCDEIGDRLGISRTAAHEYIRRARNKLEAAELPEPIRMMQPDRPTVSNQNIDEIPPDSIACQF